MQISAIAETITITIIISKLIHELAIAENNNNNNIKTKIKNAKTKQT